MYEYLSMFTTRVYCLFAAGAAVAGAGAGAAGAAAVDAAPTAAGAVAAGAGTVALLAMPLLCACVAPNIQL